MHETNEFKGLFKDGLSYLPGGVDDGFVKVDRDAFTTRLLEVKGKRRIQVSQVELAASSVNQGDVFILDAGPNVYQWNGAKSSRMEKQKAMDATKKIRDEEHGGKSKIHIIDHGDDDSEFWKALGQDKPASIPEGSDDAAHEAQKAKDIKLWQLSDATGKLVMTEVTDRPLKKEMLLTEESFILDTGSSGIYAWVGKKASSQEKARAMKYAMDFIKEHNYPEWTPICKIVERAETPLFKQHFIWPLANALPMGGLGSAGSKPKFVKKSFDASSMAERDAREKIVLPDDGTGKVSIWRIENLKRVEWPAHLYGQFYGGDSYVVLYEYKDKRGKDAAFIYYWQGTKSSQDEKAAAAIEASNLDDELGGYPVQVRVVQNKEPPHFYKIFEHKVVIHTGGVGSGFKNSTEKDYQDTDGTRLFHVKCSNNYNVRAVQVAERAESLNSGDCFVLESPEMLFLWFGNGCSKEERDFTKQIFRKIDNIQCPLHPTPLMEGKESDAFWKALGGKKDYAKPPEATLPAHDPRLFQCSNARGYFWAEECFDFDQEDLCEDDCMLLDTYREIFIWIGEGANKEEREEAMKLSKTYLSNDTSGRQEDDVSIAVIQQGCEPPNFSCHFMAWDDDKWRKGKTYEQMKAEMNSGEELSLEQHLEKFKGTTYTMAELKGDKSKLEFLNRKEPESHLSNDEFKQYMKMDKAAFAKLANWKKISARKAAGL